MIKVISEIMARYDIWNTIVNAINLCYSNKMIRAVMFVIRNHCRIKCHSNALQLEPCNVMFKVISDKMARKHDLREIQL